MSKEGPWPECVGMIGRACVQKIQSLAPDVRGNVFIVEPGSILNMDFRTNRVWVHVDENGIVTSPPGRG
jgi:hypothetical protein